MKIKSKFGQGLESKKKKKLVKRKRKTKPSTTFNAIVKAASKLIVHGKNAHNVISSALKGARSAVKNSGGKKKVKMPRILRLPSKTGGALPFLIQLFAGLSATGALTGGASDIMKEINEAKASRQQLEESQRHNKTMEAIALGKGLYLKPIKVEWDSISSPTLLVKV